MAQSNLIYPLESLHGKISKKSETIFRHKAVYDKNGNVIAQYAQESYVVEHPRDWKKHLPKGAKKQSLDYWITIFANVRRGNSNMARQILLSTLLHANHRFTPASTALSAPPSFVH